MNRNFRQRVMRVAIVSVMATSGTMLANGPAHASIPSPSAAFALQNAASGRCMAIGAGSTAGGAGVIQFSCDYLNEQHWYTYGPFRPDGPNTLPGYEIINLNSRMCLADPGDSPNNNVQLIQYGCYGGPEQLWVLGSNLAGWTFTRWRSNQCAADGASSQADGAPIVQWTCDGNPEQSWVMQPA